LGSRGGERDRGRERGERKEGEWGERKKR